MLLIGACVFVWRGMSDRPPSDSSPDKGRLGGTISITPFFRGIQEPVWNERLFVSNQPLSSEKRSPQKPCLPLLVLPHYAPVFREMERALDAHRACSSLSPKRVVVISPNHDQALEKGFATAHITFTSPRWELKTHDEAIVQLLHAGAQDLPELLREEHGVAVPLTLTRATLFSLEQVVPIVLSRSITQEEARSLANVLREWMKDGTTLVVISADFSHYLPLNQAKRRDGETHNWLTTRNQDALWLARDTHTDFGRGLWLALELAGEASWKRYTAFDTTQTTFFTGWWE